VVRGRRVGAGGSDETMVDRQIHTQGNRRRNKPEHAQLRQQRYPSRGRKSLFPIIPQMLLCRVSLSDRSHHLVEREHTSCDIHCFVVASYQSKFHR